MRKIIADAIRNSPSDQINLGGMKVHDDELEMIVDTIVKTKPDIDSIFFDNNDIGRKGASILKEKLSKLSHLSFLDLQFNKIDKEGAVIIFSLLSNNPKLNIAFHGNGIFDQGEMDEIKANALKSD